MKSRCWSPRVLGKYVLLQLPSFALVVAFVIFLRVYFNFPLFYTWAVIAVWAAKDAIFYPFVWRAYDSLPHEPMVGLTGKVKEWSGPYGYLEIRGELWRAGAAEGFSGMNKGEIVEVQEVRGLTLIVKPCSGGTGKIDESD